MTPPPTPMRDMTDQGTLSWMLPLSFCPRGRRDDRSDCSDWSTCSPSLVFCLWQTSLIDPSTLFRQRPEFSLGILTEVAAATTDQCGRPRCICHPCYREHRIVPAQASPVGGRRCSHLRGELFSGCSPLSSWLQPQLSTSESKAWASFSGLFSHPWPLRHWAAPAAALWQGSSGEPGGLRRSRSCARASLHPGLGRVGWGSAGGMTGP